VRFRQLFQAVAYCHHKHVVHRDLKVHYCGRGGGLVPCTGLLGGYGVLTRLGFLFVQPENILLDGGANIKLADFGLSRMYDPNFKLETFCGRWVGVQRCKTRVVCCPWT
jgi:serine/threonine protein kinase